MKKFIFLFIYLISLFNYSPVYARASISEILNLLISNNILHESHNSNSELAEAICKYYGGTALDCMYVNSVGKAICKASGQDALTCINVNSIAKAICYAGNLDALTCINVNSIGKSICYVGGGDYFDCMSVNSVSDGIKKYNQKRSRDYEWAWDQFYHSNGSLVWACRGVQTGQFAEKINCLGKPKNDYRWPNK